MKKPTDPGCVCVCGFICISFCFRKKITMQIIHIHPGKLTVWTQSHGPWGSDNVPFSIGWFLGSSPLSFRAVKLQMFACWGKKNIHQANFKIPRRIDARASCAFGIPPSGYLAWPSRIIVICSWPSRVAIIAVVSCLFSSNPKHGLKADINSIHESYNIGISPMRHSDFHHISPSLKSCHFGRVLPY